MMVNLRDFRIDGEILVDKDGCRPASQAELQMWGRIVELEAEHENLLERALGEDIWLRFEGKDWVLVEAVTKALLGEGK